LKKEERSYKNYKEVKVKVMNKSVQRKVNDYEVFVRSRESS